MPEAIKLFSHASGPNSWKITILLDELEVPYEMEFLEFTVLHTPAFEKYNPNGRVPTIVDSNTNTTLWESGAIIKYLIETYDKENKFTIATAPEKFHLDQWLFFQASGQGPYFGQALWFAYFHSEKLASAKERYIKEIKRVSKVLNVALEGKTYLVGEKCTYADLAFIPWTWAVEGLSPGLKAEIESENANYKAWIDRLSARPSVVKAVTMRNEKMAPPKK